MPIQASLLQRNRPTLYHPAFSGEQTYTIPSGFVRGADRHYTSPLLQGSRPTLYHPASLGEQTDTIPPRFFMATYQNHTICATATEYSHASINEFFSHRSCTNKLSMTCIPDTCAPVYPLICPPVRIGNGLTME